MSSYYFSLVASFLVFLNWALRHKKINRSGNCTTKTLEMIASNPPYFSFTLAVTKRGGTAHPLSSPSLKREKTKKDEKEKKRKNTEVTEPRLTVCQ